VLICVGFVSVADPTHAVSGGADAGKSLIR